MFSTEEGIRAMKIFRLCLGVCGLVLSGGCTQSQLHLSDDYGRAFQENMLAQIADPDAHYLGTPAPGADGARVGLAQQRYQKNMVIQPTSITASSGAAVGNAPNGAPADAAPANSPALP
jgi:hypothetical protein